MTLEEQELLLQKQELLQLKARKLELVKAFGLPFYRPHKKQDAFHRAGRFKRRMYRAGNRSGKSQAGVAEDCAHFLGYRPWYEESDPARYEGIRQGRTKGLVVTTDWDKVDEVFTGQGRGGDVGKLWKFLPTDRVAKTKKNHSGVIDYVESKDGSVIRFDTVKSFMMNPMGAESSDHDWIHWDEPAPQAMHKAATRGLMDRGGKEWFTLTPLSEPWINDLFFPNFQAAKSLDIFEQQRKGRDLSWVVTGTTYDNPYLSEDDIEDFEATLTKDEIECRIKGLPLAMSGMVYKSFDYDRHVLKEVPAGWADFQSPPKNWPVYISIDTHPQTPHAVLFVAVSPLEQLFAFDELFVQTSIAELASYILERTVQRGYTIANPITCEPAAWINNPVTGASSMAQEFMDCGLIVEKGSKDLTAGINKTQEYLAKPDRFYVSPNLSTFLYEITHYMYTKDNKPADKDDHIMETLRRVILSEPRYFDPRQMDFDRIREAPITTGELTYAGDFDDDLSW